jgi:hypothetical protein
MDEEVRDVRVFEFKQLNQNGLLFAFGVGLPGFAAGLFFRLLGFFALLAASWVERKASTSLRWVGVLGFPPMR